jgi:hypothetical protein
MDLIGFKLLGLDLAGFFSIKINLESTVSFVFMMTSGLDFSLPSVLDGK